MHADKKNVLLISMPFAGVSIPSIQLAVLETYLRERGISIQTQHLYLKAVDSYGLQNYNFLIYPPNDSYTAQMVFSRYVFPEHWTKEEEKFREYFQKTVTKNRETQQFNFDVYIQKTDEFYHWVIENINWQMYDIIGFTLNYGQLFPSLAVAKKIKELYPEKKIIFGGSRTVDNMGLNVLKTFPYVDFIVSGEGEEALYRLASDYENHSSIPRLMYRTGNDVLWNQTEEIIDINSLPIPSYGSFFEQLETASDELKQYFAYYGRLPIEISRGCWWNRCTFCNLNIQFKKYREKSVDRFIEELQFLSNKYNMLDFQIIGNTLPKTDYKLLFEKLIKLGKDYNLVVEARAGQLKSDEYVLMKKAGFTIIQTGIESFSTNYLKKMNKGARVIDNIAALKFCKENGIENQYNLVVNYPNEELIDFEETKKTVQLLKQHLDPPQVCPLKVFYGSPIQKNPEQFNIESLDYAPLDKMMYPMEVLDKGISFVYGFKRKNDLGENNWDQLVDDWRKERERLALEGVKRNTPIDKLIFYFVDGINFVRIYDRRDGQEIKIYVLDETERKIFLACTDVISYCNLKERFPDVSEQQLATVLESFEQNSIVFHEDDCYLSLPLRCNTRLVTQPVKEEFLLVSD